MFCSLVLGIFPKTFSQERQYPKRDFPSDNIPRETSQVTISQERLPKWLYPKWHIPKCAISLTATFQRLGYARQWGPSAVTRMGWGREGLGLWLRHILTLVKLHIWKFTLESFRSEKKPLGKYTAKSYLFDFSFYTPSVRCA